MRELEDFEVSMLLDAIEHRWGYDFRAYARASIKRRIRNAMIRHRVQHVSALIPRILHEPDFFQDVVRDFSITVTQMFRDPHIWSILREEVFNLLATWPYFKIWHAACATGEEVYSMAILLDEAGLLDRATIYATDFNDEALQKARDGIYPLKDIQEASRNYLKAGGAASLNQYYLALEDVVQIRKAIRDRIVWANHNLVQDRVFGEMNLILCRNVMIYFTRPLQNRALELFTASLTHGGILCLGSKESLDFSSVADCYDAISLKDRIYRRMRGDEVEPIDFRVPKDKAEAPPPPSVPGVLAIGCSMGGLKALRTLLPALPVDFALPVLVTQHIAPSPESAMAEVLQQGCALTVKEATHGEKVAPGTVYLAPADYHMLLNDDWTIVLSSDARDHYARPSINVMFESVAELCGNRSIAALLTGANADGAKGLAAIKAEGGYILVQDPADAEAPAMPLAALDMVKPDRVLALARMATAIKTRARLLTPVRTHSHSNRSA